MFGKKRFFRAVVASLSTIMMVQALSLPPLRPVATADGTSVIWSGTSSASTLITQLSNVSSAVSSQLPGFSGTVWVSFTDGTFQKWSNNLTLSPNNWVAVGNLETTLPSWTAWYDDLAISISEWFNWW